MTAEHPADTMIKQAARAITAALADAGLLADPADRDELYLQGYLQGYQNGYKHAEAERDEAERDEAERDHAREMAELAEKDRRTYHQDAIRAEAKLAQTEVALGDAMAAEVAELRAMRDRVRGLADRWERWGHDGVPIRPSTAAGYLRAELDGAGGEQHGE